MTRVAIVTGGGTGIGAEIARRLVADGLDVVITGRRRPEPASLADVREAWLAQFDTNVVSAVLMTLALTPRLADDARVIAMGSIAGARGSGSGSYGAVKAAVHTWAAGLAGELGGRGITVNSIAPGLVDDPGGGGA